MDSNPGVILDDLGVTCEELFLRFKRTGNFVAQQATWDAAQEFSDRAQLMKNWTPDTFGAET